MGYIIRTGAKLKIPAKFAARVNKNKLVVAALKQKSFRTKR